MDHIKEVLFLLLRIDSNAYKICQELYKTGFTYKRDLLDAIYYMEKAKLITKEKIRGYSVKRNISLSEFGRKLGNLILNVVNYLERYLKLVEAVNSKFEVSDADRDELVELNLEDKIISQNDDSTYRINIPKSVNRKLKNKGWEELERMRFTLEGYKPPRGILLLLEESPMIVNNMLLYKYRMLLEEGLNDIAKTIARRIIIDLITEVMTHVHARTRSGSESSEVDRIASYIMKLAMDILKTVVNTGGFRYRFIFDEVSDVLETIFSIAGRRDETAKELSHLIERERKREKFDRKISQEKNSPNYGYCDDNIFSAIPFFNRINR